MSESLAQLQKLASSASGALQSSLSSVVKSASSAVSKVTSTIGSISNSVVTSAGSAVKTISGAVSSAASSAKDSASSAISSVVKTVSDSVSGVKNSANSATSSALEEIANLKAIGESIAQVAEIRGYVAKNAPDVFLSLPDIAPLVGQLPAAPASELPEGLEGLLAMLQKALTAPTDMLAGLSFISQSLFMLPFTISNAIGGVFAKVLYDFLAAARVNLVFNRSLIRSRVNEVFA